MAHERLRPQFLFDEGKLKQLKQLAPECFEDGKINFETLRQNLGDWAQDEEDKDLEHFGLFWPGKRDARRIASTPPQGTLEPVFGEGLKSDGTPDTDGLNDSKNIFIEGENLEVLKILQKSYAGKIKMIYIDPPYNTGNDFVYDDDFTEPLQEYLRRTGQVDEEGKLLTTNKRSDGRFHSKWLSMMYPRLRLARNLLTEDGVIFVSIDDNEVHNLRAIMNEIFGEENFLGLFVINSSPSAIDYGHFAKQHDYAIFYSKNADETVTNHLPEKDKVFKYTDAKGPFNIYPLYNGNVAFNPKTRPNLYYPFYLNPKNKILEDFYEIDVNPHKDWVEVYPVISQKDGIQRVWRWGKSKASENLNDEIIGYKTEDGEFRIVQKTRLPGKVIRSLHVDKDISSRRGTGEVEELFKAKVFSFPKAVELLKRFILVGTGPNDTILDFFAGSGSIAHAVYDINSEYGGNRKFICVQLPEITDESSTAYQSGYKFITEITKARIQKASRKYRSKGSNENDWGVFVSRLVPSNFVKWSNYSGLSTKDLEKTLEMFNNNPIRKDTTNHSLLLEIILLEGFTLCSSLKKLENYVANNIIQISDEYSEHSLQVCLDHEIKSTTIKELVLTGSDVFICLDSAISNVDKLRLSDKGLIKTI